MIYVCIKDFIGCVERWCLEQYWISYFDEEYDSTISGLKFLIYLLEGMASFGEGFNEIILRVPSRIDHTCLKLFI